MKVVETPTTYRFQLLDLQSRYSADHIRLLFAASNRFILRKNKGDTPSETGVMGLLRSILFRLVFRTILSRLGRICCNSD